MTYTEEEITEMKDKHYTQIESLTTELTTARASAESWKRLEGEAQEVSDLACEKLETAKQTIKELNRYATHIFDCASHSTGLNRLACSCGLDNILTQPPVEAGK